MLVHGFRRFFLLLFFRGRRDFLRLFLRLFLGELFLLHAARAFFRFRFAAAFCFALRLALRFFDFFFLAMSDLLFFFGAALRDFRRIGFIKNGVPAICHLPGEQAPFE